MSEVDGIRTAIVTDETTEYTTVFDTTNSTIQVFAKDISTNIVSVGAKVVSNEEEFLPENSPRSFTIHQDTFTNFEYDIWAYNPQEWRLERPNGAFSQYYFKVYENSSNSSSLNEWFNAVNTLNDREWEAIASCSLALVSDAAAGFISGMAIASGGILSPAAITSIATAVGATGVGIAKIVAVGTQCNAALLAYSNVMRTSDNFHY